MAGRRFLVYDTDAVPTFTETLTSGMGKVTLKGKGWYRVSRIPLRASLSSFTGSLVLRVIVLMGR